MKKYILILQLSLFCFVSSMLAQNKISGIVTGTNGQPLKNVIAILKNSEDRVKISSEGRFTVTLSFPDSLLIQKEGYYNEVVSISPESKAFHIQLRKMEEYDGKINLPFNRSVSLRYYTGAVGKISGEEMNVFRTHNNANTLAGRLAGLTTIQGSDEPGYAGASLIIRGRSSFRNDAINSFVDNVPAASIGGAGAFTDLDPLEIDQLVIMKDGVANGVYGQKGANKSIFVTTKRGQAFNNQINVYSAYGIERAAGLPTFAGAQQYMLWHNEARRNDGLPTIYNDPAQIDAYNGPHDPYKYPDVDWYGSNLNQSAGFQKYNIALSGGNNIVRYFILGGVNIETGLYKNGDYNLSKYGYKTNQQYNRYNLRSNFDFTINKNLTAFIDISARMKDITNPGVGESPASKIFTRLATYPSNLFPITYANGEIGGNAQYPDNPYGFITRLGNTGVSTRIAFGNVGLKQNLDVLLKGLSVSATYVFYNSFFDNNGFIGGNPKFAVYQMDAAGTLKSLNTDVLPTYTTSVGTQQRINTIWAKAEYNKQWRNNHELNTLMGYWQSIRISGNEDFNFPYVSVNFFNQTHYQFKKRYLADFSLSYSGSEVFPPGHRFGLFPSLGAGWIVSEESFLKGVKAINFLKLRASYALLGNSDLTGTTGRGRFIYSPLYNTNQTGYVFGTTPASTTGVVEGAIVNSDVTWENQSMGNVGLDVSTFSNTLGFTLDVFMEKRSRILATPRNISALIGQTIAMQNIGIVTNKGLDATVWYANKAGQFDYKLSGNIGLNKNNIVFQAEAPQPYDYLYRTGNPIGTVFGYQSLGFFKDDAEIAASPKQLFSVVRPGDIKYKDTNKDGVIDVTDQVAISNSGTPGLSYGFSAILSYKGIKLSAYFQGASNYAISTVSLATQGFYNGAKPSAQMLNRWTPATAAQALYPRFSFNAANNYQTSDFWIKEAHYLRLKSIEISYDLPASVLKYIHLKGVRFYTSGLNLFTWSNVGNDFVDPEFTSAGITTYPRLKNLTFGLDINL